MNSRTELLLGLRRIVKFYEASMKPVENRFGLSHMETEILAFLHNNPGRDTASDIVELRMFKKGNVSLAAESLCKRGLLSRQRDLDDRRKSHLHVTEAAQEILEEIESARQSFQTRLFSGFSEDELSLFQSLNSRLFENALAGLENRKGHTKDKSNRFNSKEGTVNDRK